MKLTCIIMDDCFRSTDPTLEPLKVYIGKGHVLAGMDLALRGRCLGEEIDVKIPPSLAFDDESRFGEGEDKQCTLCPPMALLAPGGTLTPSLRNEVHARKLGSAVKRDAG